MPSSTITIDIPADREAVIRRFLAYMEEIENLAASAADGTVLDVCEEAVLEKGPDIDRQVLSAAVARRVEAAEKKGHQSASASVAGPRRIAVRRPGN